MATRLYLCAADATPVTPGFAAWQETDGALRRRMRSFTGGDTLANGSAQASTAGNTQLHRQYVSDPLASGITFTNGVSTFSCQIQGLESAANDNIINRVRAVKVVSQDGTTLQATLIALGSAASTAEWNTSMRNLTFLNATAVGAGYTTVAGDRLVLEVGHDDSGGASVSGTLRFGADSGGTGDLGSNETDTTTTLRPWFESSVNLTFLAQDVSGAHLAGTTLNASTVALNVSGATITGTQLFAGTVPQVVTGATIRRGLLAQDNFNRAAGGLGGNWTTLDAYGAPSIANEEIQGPGSRRGAFYTGVAAPDDQFSEVRVQLFVGRVIVRATNVASDSDFYYAEATTQSTAISIGKFTHAVGDVALISGNRPNSNACRLGLSVKGTKLVLYIDGDPLLEVTDASFSSGGYGVAVGNVGGDAIDDWIGSDSAGTQLFAGTVTTAGDAVVGAHIAGTSLFAGTSALATEGATIAGTTLFAGTATLGLAGAHISTTQVFAGQAALSLAGAHLASTQVFAGTVSLSATGANITTTQLFAGTATLNLTGAHVSITQLFAGTVTATGSVAGSHIASTQLFAGSASLTTSGAHVAGTQLFTGSVALAIGGAHVSTTQLFTGLTSLSVTGATIATTAQLFPGTVGGAIGPSADDVDFVLVKALDRWVLVPRTPSVIIKSADRSVVIERE